MVNNYLQLAFRRMRQHKTFALVNILGLTIGFAIGLLIFLFVQHEWRFDRFHADHERIFRVTTINTEEGVSRHKANAYAPLADLLQANFPNAKHIVRYFPVNASVKNPVNNALFQEQDFFFADSLFFEVFDFRFLAGDKATALRHPYSLVMTETAARRYFGDGDPVGKTLLAEGKTALTVTGVVAAPTGGSTLQFDLLASFSSAKAVMGYEEFGNPKRGGWFHPAVFTFVKFPDLADAEIMQRGMADFENTHLPKHLRGRYNFQLQPLADMHFTTLEGDLQPAMKPSYLNILVAVAFLILIIACANYVNLTMAGMLRRFREIGMRRVLGAGVKQVLQQLSTETLVFLCLSFVLALIVVQMGLPAFNNLVDRQLSLRDITPAGWAIVATGILGIGWVIALLPYFATNRLGLASMLKNVVSRFDGRLTGRFTLKNAFIVFQFSGAVALLVATVVILRQLNFLRNKELGLQTKQILVIPIRDEVLQNNFAAAKQVLSAIPGVTSVSAISNFPWEKGFYDFPTTLSGQGKNVEANLQTLLVDKDFVETMGMKITHGHSIAQISERDTNPAFLLNEAATARFGIEQLDGLRLRMKGVATGGARQGEVVGIVGDFHLQSLHHPVEPLAILMAPESYYLDNFVLQIQSENLSQTLKSLSEQWLKLVPARPFEYFFLDDTFASLYRRETKEGVIFSWLSVLAMFIACLGLFALAAILCERRTKEIGIRKVLGASVANVTSLLTKDFLKLVVASCAIAFPVAYFFMQKWLSDFAYRIDIQWWMFATAGAVAVAVAFLTVGFQSVKAALANPVKSLRSE